LAVDVFGLSLIKLVWAVATSLGVSTSTYWQTCGALVDN